MAAAGRYRIALVFRWASYALLEQVPYAFHEPPERVNLRLETDQKMENPSLCDIHMFIVADGSFVDRNKHDDWDWFNPHVRLVGLVTPAGAPLFGRTAGQWTLCIVGSGNIKDSSRESSFLQVASWDATTFRFYQV